MAYEYILSEREGEGQVGVSEGVLPPGVKPFVHLQGQAVVLQGPFVLSLRLPHQAHVVEAEGRTRVSMGVGYFGVEPFVHLLRLAEVLQVRPDYLLRPVRRLSPRRPGRPATRVPRKHPLPP